jgi:hypothetical protein
MTCAPRRPGAPTPAQSAKHMWPHPPRRGASTESSRMTAFAGTGIQTRQTPKDLYNGTAGPAVEGNNDTVTLPRARLNDAPSRDQLARGGTCRKVRDAIASWAACPTAPRTPRNATGTSSIRRGRSRTYFLSELPALSLPVKELITYGHSDVRRGAALVSRR